MNRVTVVIPVYKDWSTLAKCIESLKRYLDAKNEVILVNDMGAEWESLEKNILESINGCHNFIYKKNESNIGFVKTCNKAVLACDKGDNDILLLNSDTEVTEGFLEEMQRILYMDEKTGVVCPRSNNATFLSVPINRNGYSVSAEESYRIYQQIKTFLPEREECWTGVGFAFLIKRQLIQEFGLFDEVFGRGYNEENDFCMRIKKQGYRVMKANYAYVFHMGKVSFQEEKDELELKNSSILLRRYPYYWDMAKKFQCKVDAVDYFADILTDIIYEKRRILIAILENMPKGRLIEIIRQCKESDKLVQYDYDIVVSEENWEKIRRHAEKEGVCSLDKLVGTYHIAYILIDMEEMECREGVLKKYSPRVIVAKGLEHLDIGQDIAKSELLDADCAARLRAEWKICQQGRDSVTCIAGEKSWGVWIKKMKMYLYTHHIWVYVVWHRIRRITGKKNAAY